MKDAKTRKPGHKPSGTTPADPDKRSRGGRPRRTVFPDKPPTKTRCPWRKLRPEVGAGLPLVQQLQKERRNDPFAQLAGFFREFRIEAATGRKRTVGFKTRHKYVHIMMRVLETLRELNMRIQNLTELSAGRCATFIASGRPMAPPTRRLRCSTPCCGASASGSASRSWRLRCGNCW